MKHNNIYVVLEFITRDTNFEDVAVVANDRANLEDVGCNADLYIANQEDFTQGAISISQP